MDGFFFHFDLSRPSILTCESQAVTVFLVGEFSFLTVGLYSIEIDPVRARF